MTAFLSCGIGMPSVMKLVFVLSLPVAMMAAYVSLCIRRDAWREIYRVMDEAESSLTFLGSTRCIPRTPVGESRFLRKEVRVDDQSAQNVFIRMEEGETRRVIRAQQMTQAEGADGRRELHFQEGSVYEIPPKGQPVTITRFNQANYSLPIGLPHSRYRRKATPTEQLVGSSRLVDIAEIQWRLSAPLSTILLALCGVPLSKSNPRKGKFARIGVAIVIFAFYFQLFSIARTWVGKAVVSPLIGIWWVPALLIGLTLLLLWRTAEVFYRRP